MLGSPRLEQVFVVTTWSPGRRPLRRLYFNAISADRAVDRAHRRGHVAVAVSALLDDDPERPMISDERWRAIFGHRGETPEQAAARLAEFRVLRDLRNSLVK